MSAIRKDEREIVLAEYLQSASGKPVGHAANVSLAPPGKPIPLAPSQRQIWAHSQLAPHSPLYNEPFTIHRHGHLNIADLERSLTSIIQRHATWRTTFEMAGGDVVQRVHPGFDVCLPVLDLSNFPVDERNDRAMLAAAEDAARPFDITKLPLFRCKLVKLSGEDYRLFVTCHHLIFDGITGYHVFLSELASLYEAFATGKPFPLAELPFQYADYSSWRCYQERDANLSADIGYWRSHLEGTSPLLELPTDLPRPATITYRGAMKSFVLAPELRDSLLNLSRQESTTLFTTLLAVFAVLLYRYSGQDDIVIGTVTSGRDVPGTEELMGYFLNTIAVRSDLSGEPSFYDFLRRVRANVIGALDHDRVGLDQIIGKLHPDRDMSRSPLFQVLLSMEPSLASFPEGWDFSAIDVETGTAKYDLTMVLDDRPDGVSGKLIYSTDLFEPGTIARMIDCWKTLLESVVASPETPISRLRLLSSDEVCQLQLLEGGEGSEQTPPTVPVLFQQVTRSRPDSIVLCTESMQLSWAGLERLSNQLAHRLLANGAGGQRPVALYLTQPEGMVLGILAAMKAGAPYVPLDRAYPQERLAFMLQDSGACVLVTDGMAPIVNGATAAVTIAIDLTRSGSWSEPFSTPAVSVDHDDLAYILYTSGSSGQPKGVEVTHGNLAYSTAARLEYYGRGVGTFLLLSSFSFDSSVAVIFHSLCTGGTLVVPPSATKVNPQAIARVIREHHVSDVLCVPSLYDTLLENSAPGDLASLKRVIVAGESCVPKLVDRHFKQLPKADLFNEYGPTEATVWSSVYRCERGKPSASVPIGQPINYTQLYILDKHLERLPRGAVGELCIGGKGVARGYHNATEMTAQRFVTNPFNSEQGGRIYRTGDLARYLPDGNVQLLGRMDNQVKIRGLRIELGEIESLLSSHPDVREAVVAVWGGEQSENAGIVAHIVPRQAFATTDEELRSFLKRRLPAYMVPAVFSFHDSIPRTPNGKIDRESLSLSVPEGPVVAKAAPKMDDSFQNDLLSIWRQVLGPAVVNVDQDFFALGGHSLIAGQLLQRVEDKTGEALSLSFIFQAPTVRLMAEWLRSPDHSLRARTIIPIQPSGSGSPLFWIRGGPRFRLLAQHLGPEQPFLGLDLPYADAAKLTAPFSLEDIACFMIRALKEVQPHGPYSLAGLCVNAVIAFEIGRQLTTAGDEVALLAMFDAHNQAYYKHPLRDGRYTGRIKYHLSNMLGLNMRETSAYMLERLEEARRKVERRMWQLTAEDHSDSETRHNTDPFIIPAFHRYEPLPFPGKIVLFQSSQWPDAPYFDFATGWKDLVRDMEFHRIPGSHRAMFTEPNVALVAESLSPHLIGTLLNVQKNA